MKRVFLVLFICSLTFLTTMSNSKEIKQNSPKDILNEQEERIITYQTEYVANQDEAIIFIKSASMAIEDVYNNIKYDGIVFKSLEKRGGYFTAYFDLPNTGFYTVYYKNVCTNFNVIDEIELQSKVLPPTLSTH